MGAHKGCKDFFEDVLECGCKRCTSNTPMPAFWLSLLYDARASALDSNLAVTFMSTVERGRHVCRDHFFVGLQGTTKTAPSPSLLQFIWPRSIQLQRARLCVSSGLRAEPKDRPRFSTCSHKLKSTPWIWTVAAMGVAASNLLHAAAIVGVGSMKLFFSGAA
ncbi:hypothetical protein TraAM80_07022 [Trypanosoma rangeli]|uniref:Uncharacterized protein n=1 Tax=Trypanosoma rangeli TaxID=5698 RepID=A0A422N7F3_TRYRA|nr:uncharacterized protein TraAM80_07022 [Trypanosoma rangeli]RNF01375.1 hypothetical protein TraAM80_07022 [Trypanosoma rangeli]|eukprot:RNF01375.1 hypothetical protein TraAM80_07022 [Trypanosoma rangeli]